MNNSSNLSKEIYSYIDKFWDNEVIPQLVDYIKIPNKSPAFDPDWEKNGYMEKVLDQAVKWSKKHAPDNSTFRIERPKGRTPLILIDIPGEKEGNVLMYGHLDKQPEMVGWNEGLGPWKPVIKDNKLFGRGGADDGYAIFACIAAIQSLKKQNIDLPRIVVLIEFCEESGSPDLPYYMDKCEDFIGDINLVICLDSGAGNYEQFWTTVSLRGMIACELRVDVLEEGVHSGSASGVVPSPFRILNQLINRIENPQNGEISIDALNVDIPKKRVAEAKEMVTSLVGWEKEFPWHQNTKPSSDNSLESMLRRTWKPTMTVIGADGIPSIKDGGNVLLPYAALNLSFRLPPTADCKLAIEAVETILLNNPPNDAKISIKWEKSANGWNAPDNKKWLNQAIDNASQAIFNSPARAMGEGGTIPFMAMLGEKFPMAQFVITGVLGPNSNAHGPNEFIHIPFAKKLNTCIALILSHYNR